jgi:hypothetical protein
MRHTLCTACHRHVRTGDPVCPFCNGAMATVSRLPIAAAFVAGLGLACSACYGPPRYQLRDIKSRGAATADAGGHLNVGSADRAPP